MKIWFKYSNGMMKKRSRILSIFLIVVITLGLTALIIYSLSYHTNWAIISSEKRCRSLLYVTKSYSPNLSTPLKIKLHGFAQPPTYRTNNLLLS